MARIFPLVDFPESGWLTREEMIEVDRIMMEDLGISLRKMMEHAGRHLATVVRLKRNELGVRPQVRSSVVVLVGAEETEAVGWWLLGGFIVGAFR